MKILHLNRTLVLSFLRRHYRTLLPFINTRKLLNIALSFIEYLAACVRCRSYPFMFRIDPCTLCNLRCVSCPSHSKATNEKRIMELSDFKAIIEIIHKYAIRVSLYDSGEPLLNPDIYKMVEYASRHRISTLINSNLNLFKDGDAAKMLNSGLTVIVPSLDGISQDTYQKYRVGGNVELVKHGILNIVKTKRDRSAKYPIIDVQVILFNHLMGEIKAIETFVMESGANMVTYLEECGGFDRPIENLASSRSNSSNKCFWLYFGIIIMPNGNVYPCCVNKHFVYGNILRQGIAEIWNNDYYQFSRSLFNSGPDIDYDQRFKEIPCLNCTLFKTKRSMKNQKQKGQ